MFNALPDVVDAWRMVNARRIFAGQLPLAVMTRLADSLSDTDGECRYQVEFGRDEFGVAFIGIEAEAALPLVCQRTLERFEFAVSISQRIGLIRDEREEASLPPGYEPVLLDLDARLKTADLIEDELILALPVVPVKPGTEAIEAQWSNAEAEDEEDVRPNPFAALSSLKASKPKQQ